MRGVDHTRSRLSAARAFFAGVAILAGAFAPAAQASANDETAIAVPRIAPLDGNAGVALPQPLGPSDVVLVHRAFLLQDRGDLPAADRAIAEVTNQLLLGHLRAARDLGRFNRATADELTDWLDRYASQPDAPAIRALLLRRQPKGSAVPPLPAMASLPSLPSLAEHAAIPPLPIFAAFPPPLPAPSATSLHCACSRPLSARFRSVPALPGFPASWRFPRNTRAKRRQSADAPNRWPVASGRRPRCRGSRRWRRPWRPACNTGALHPRFG